MTTLPSAAQALNALDAPTLLVDRGGGIRHANRAARLLTGHGALPEDLHALHRGERHVLDRFLDRCSGSVAPLMGALLLEGPDGATVRLPVKGSRIEAAGEALILLCGQRSGDHRFRTLTDQVDALSRETQERRDAQARLEASLAERDMLLAELHHRVRNMLHRLGAMLNGAAREAEAPAAAAALKDAAARVTAIGLVHRLLASGMDGLKLDGRVLVAALGDAAGVPVREEGTAPPAVLDGDRATSVALIVHELLAEASGSGGATLAIGGAAPGGGLLVRVACAHGRFGAAPAAAATGQGLAHALARGEGLRLMPSADGRSIALDLPAGART